MLVPLPPGAWQGLESSRFLVLASGLTVACKSLVLAARVHLPGGQKGRGVAAQARVLARGGNL